MRIALTVNGERREADVWEGESLLYALRERLGLPGSKNACEQGECGSCSVLLDGELVCACLVLAAQADGHEVVTVEGLARRRASCTPCSRRSSTRAPSSAASARPASSSPTADLLARAPEPERRRDPRGALRQPLPLHRLREDLRRRPARRRRPMSTTRARRAALELGRVGESVAARRRRSRRSTGEFAYSSDLSAAGMLWGHTVRSPHAHARIARSTSPRRSTLPGVHAVLTHDDVPGEKTYGLEFADQPVLAIDRVRYFGEPVALVAAEHPEQARRAAERDPRRVRAARAGRRHGARDRVGAAAPRPPDEGPRLPRRPAPERRPPHRDPARRPRRGGRRRPSSGAYELGIQDQAFLGPESGLAVPDGEGGVDIYVATQWLHVDRDQVAPCLGLPPEQVRIHLAGVGGAFGGREDLSMQIHGALLALHTNRPGEDRLQPRGVVHRPRAPPPGADLGRAPRDARRAARLRPHADPARRRRVRLELDRGHLERRVRSRVGPYAVAERADRVDVSSTRTTRRAARCAASAPCRRASPPRRRWTSSPPRSASTRSSCGC